MATTTRVICGAERSRLADDAAATVVIEVHKRKPGLGIASCRSAIAGALGN
jgi:hypothetical protein